MCVTSSAPECKTDLKANLKVLFLNVKRQRGKCGLVWRKTVWQNSKGVPGFNKARYAVKQTVVYKTFNGL